MGLGIELCPSLQRCVAVSSVGEQELTDILNADAQAVGRPVAEVKRDWRGCIDEHWRHHFRPDRPTVRTRLVLLVHAMRVRQGTAQSTLPATVWENAAKQLCGTYEVLGWEHCPHSAWVFSGVDEWVRSRRRFVHRKERALARLQRQEPESPRVLQTCAAHRIRLPA